MLEKHIVDQIAAIISANIEPDFSVSHTESLGGGCVNHAYRIAGDRQSYFVKLNDRQWLANFQAEYAGLRQLAASETIRVPQPLVVTTISERAVLITEYLALIDSEAANADDPNLWQQMGSQLAQLHSTPIKTINNRLQDSEGDAGAVSSSPLLLPEDGFGGYIANSTLGNRPGFLGVDSSWSDFFVSHRLEFQFHQVRQIHNTSFENEERALATAHTLLSPPHHDPKPSLTHGDLWAGNASFATVRRAQNDADVSRSHIMFPVVFDPAPYIADGETDLALSELFGGFPPAFYRGYQARLPITTEYQQHRTIYNLYHILNHYNLFGGGYRHQAQIMINQICQYT